MTSVKATITIRDDQKAWLKDHPEFNFSGAVQRWLDNYIAGFEGPAKYRDDKRNSKTATKCEHEQHI